MKIVIPAINGWSTQFRVWLGRNSENNRALSFAGRDGLNQRSRGYWHKTFWFGPLFFSVARAWPGQATWC